MTLRTRIFLLGALTLSIGVGDWLYEAWPAWFGEDVYVVASIGAREPRSARVVLDLPDRRLPTSLPRIGLPASSHARALRGLTVYLQMDPRGDDLGEGRRTSRPVSLSAARVAGAINLRVRAGLVDPEGHVEIALGPRLFPVPSSVPTGAPAWAVLRVLPSGRYAMVDLRVR